MSLKSIVVNVIFLTLFVSCVSTHDKFSGLLNTWDNKNTPGGVIAVVQDGDVLYKNGYGMANLEYGEPITADTRFSVASVSKQFTAYSIFILESRGLLSLDDDIRIYLPEVPEFGETIRVKDLIYHTSGLRESFTLYCVSGHVGWNEYGFYSEVEPIYNQDTLELVKNQKKLQSVPGKVFTYNNTGYTLLAEIVSRVSGKDFLTFTDEEIFKKLGMESSGFVNHEDLLTDKETLSYYYLPMEDRYEVHKELFFAVGASQLYSTVNDLLLWLDYLSDGYSSGDELVKRLLTPGVGSYCGGIFVGNFHGYKKFGHGGLTASFTSQINFVPELNLLYVMLSNSHELNTSDYILEIVDSVLDNREPVYSENDIEEVVVSREILEQYTHEYYAPDYGSTFKFTIRDDQLICNDLTSLTPVSENSFYLNDSYDTKFVFIQERGDKPTLYLDTPARSIKTRLIKRDEDKDLKRFTGTYYSVELDVYYTIEENDGQLVTETVNGDLINLYHFSGKEVFGDAFFFTYLMFKQDFSGFSVSSSDGGRDKSYRRMRDVEFVRVKKQR